MSHPVARLAVATVLGAVIALAVTGLSDSPRTSEAAPEKGVSIRYIYVTGEGSVTKAWYDGVPSPGIPVQNALDKFAKEGFRVARLTDNLRSTSDDVAFAIVLQRVIE